MRRPGLIVAKLRERQKVPHRVSFSSPLAWLVGPGTIRPETNAPHSVQRTEFSQKLVVRAQKSIFFMAGFCVNLA